MSDIYEARQRQQADRDKFRAAAARLYGVTVSPMANVQPMADGGAYVEINVWVPQEEIDNPSTPVEDLIDFAVEQMANTIREEQAAKASRE